MVDCEKKDRCVCHILKEIAEKQRLIDINEQEPCLGDGIRLNTIPFLLICNTGCEYFIGAGIFKQTGSMFFNCIQSPVFRVSSVDEKNCCAEIELLQAQTAVGTVPTPISKGSVCRFFPQNTIKRFIRTGICITVNLNCYCGIECLQAVRAIRETPQLPPAPCTNPVITINAPDTIGCTPVIIEGTLTCDGNPVANQPITLTSSPGIVIFNMTTVYTDNNGMFRVFAYVPEDTISQPVLITAQTTLNGVVATVSDTATAYCPASGGGCFNNCGIHIGTQNATADATITTLDGTFNYLNGSITINAQSCGNSCNPNVQNFTISFSQGTGQNRTTFNFVGVPSSANCVFGTSATISGPATVTGTNPFPTNYLFDNVTITLINLGSGTWQVTATDGMGNTFSSTFTGTVNPDVIIDCS